MIFFKPFFFPNTHEVNTYIVGCKKTKEALLVDAGGATDEYEDFLKLEEAHLTGIFLTHLHWDHTAALESILLKHDVPVFSLNGQTPNGRHLMDDERIPLGNLKLWALQTTGHTPNSISLQVENCLLFTGDALFAGSIGGTGSPAEQEEEKESIIQKIFCLPDTMLVCPGHGPMSTVGIEKKANPFFV